MGEYSVLSPLNQMEISKDIFGRLKKMFPFLEALTILTDSPPSK